jgi:mannose-6-phosphate isomerase-like protein (cupin superfamily)
MSGDARPIHAARGEGDSLRNPVATGGPLEIKARGEETGGALTACESVTMRGEGPPFHKHANEDEVMYFVDGAFRLRIEDEVMDMAPGSFAFVPPDTPPPRR